MKLPNNYGSIYKLSGTRRKPWAVRISDPVTKERHLLCCCETKEEALAALAKYHVSPLDLSSGKITFSELYDRWSEEHFRKVTPSRVRAIRSAFNACSDIHNMRFADIRLAHLQHVIDSSKKNYPILILMKQLFSFLFRYAMQNDIVMKDYSKFVDVRQYSGKNPDAITRAPFSSDEISRIWSAFESNQVYTMILCMIYTGCRIGELLDLKKENLCIEDRYFDVIASKTKSGIRRVPIAKKILPFFEYWYSNSGCEYLFSVNGSHYNYRLFLNHYRSALQNLSMDHTPHDTRHTCVSLLDAAGVDSRIVKMIVGHKSSDVTESVYMHRDFSRLLEAIDLI